VQQTNINSFTDKLEKHLYTNTIILENVDNTHLFIVLLTDNVQN